VRAACLEFGAERLGDLEVDDQFEKQLDKAYFQRMRERVAAVLK
jgi:hypothetical protein